MRGTGPARRWLPAAAHLSGAGASEAVSQRRWSNATVSRRRRHDPMTWRCRGIPFRHRAALGIHDPAASDRRLGAKRPRRRWWTPGDRARLDHRRADRRRRARRLCAGVRRRCGDAGRLRRAGCSSAAAWAPPSSRAARSRPTRRCSGWAARCSAGSLLGGLLEALGSGVRRRLRLPALGIVDGLRRRCAGGGARARARVDRRRRRAADAGRARRCARHPALGDPARAQRRCCRRPGRCSTRWRASTRSRASTGPSADVPAAARGDRARSRRCRRPPPASCGSCGDRVRARRRGLGLGRRPGRRRDQRARRRRPGRHDRAARRRAAEPRRRRPSPSTRATTSRCCASTGSAAPRCRSPSDPRRRAGARSSASRENGPYDVRAARIGRDAHGAHAGRLRPRAGAPTDDDVPRASCARATRAARSSTGDGRVLTTVFAPTARRPARRLRRAQRDRRARRCAARRRRSTPVRAPAEVDGRWLRPRAALRSAPMAKTLVIAEKPSVGRDLARVLPGPFQKHTGAGTRPSAGSKGPSTSSPGRSATSCSSPSPTSTTTSTRSGGWPTCRSSRALQARRARRALAEADDRRHAAARAATTSTSVVNACDAGREGELIFAYLYEKAGAEASRSSGCGCRR